MTCYAIHRIERIATLRHMIDHARAEVAALLPPTGATLSALHLLKECDAYLSQGDVDSAEVFFSRL